MNAVQGTGAGYGSVQSSPTPVTMSENEGSGGSHQICKLSPSEARKICCPNSLANLAFRIAAVCSTCVLSTLAFTPMYYIIGAVVTCSGAWALGSITACLVSVSLYVVYLCIEVCLRCLGCSMWE